MPDMDGQTHRDNHGKRGHMLIKTFYDADSYFRKAGNGPDWQPGGDIYNSVFSMLKTVGDYQVQEPSGGSLQITPDALILIGEDGSEEQRVREAISFDAQEEAFNRSLENADRDLQKAGRTLVAHGFNGRWDGSHPQWEQPGLLMGELVATAEQDLESVTRLIATDREGRLHITLANHDGESDLEVRECTPLQAQQLSQLLQQGEGKRAEGLWQTLETPHLPDVQWAVESEQEYRLKQTSHKVTALLEKAGLTPAYARADPVGNRVNVDVGYGRLRYTIPAETRVETIIRKTLALLSRYDPKRQGDTPASARLVRKQFAQAARRLRHMRARTISR